MHAPTALALLAVTFLAFAPNAPLDAAPHPPTKTDEAQAPPERRLTSPTAIVHVAPGQSTTLHYEVPREGTVLASARFQVGASVGGVDFDGLGECDGIRFQGAVVAGTSVFAEPDRSCGRFEAGEHTLTLTTDVAAGVVRIDLAGARFLLA